jgi:hypothetical protein
MSIYWLAEFLEQQEEYKMAPAEREYVKALLQIAAKYNKLSNGDGNGIWVGYRSAEENEDSGIGVKCGNCAFYQGQGVCKIVAQTVEEEGVCRLAAIPDGVVKSSMKDENNE